MFFDTAGSDYEMVNQTLFFNPGVSSLDVNVIIFPDVIDEGIEMFTLHLAPLIQLENVELNPSTTTIVILDGKLL